MIGGLTLQDLNTPRLFCTAVAKVRVPFPGERFSTTSAETWRDRQAVPDIGFYADPRWCDGASPREDDGWSTIFTNLADDGVTTTSGLSNEVFRRANIKPPVPYVPGPNDAAAYLRFSSESGLESSIDRQQRVCEEYALKNGLTIRRFYIDRALSGAYSLNRPALLEMMIDVARNRYKHVIVEKLDRLSRDMADMHRDAKRIWRKGVVLHDVLNGGPVSKSDLAFGSLHAEEFLETLKKRCAQGRRSFVLERNLSPHRPAFGYMLDRLRGHRRLHPERAPAVKSFFEDYVAKASLAEIAAAATGRYQTPNDSARADCGDQDAVGRMGVWTTNMVRRIIRNPIYRGCIIDGVTEAVHDPDTGDTIEELLRPEAEWRQAYNPMLRIVSDEVWQAAQVRINDNYYMMAKAPRSDRYLLTGVAVCGCCGTDVQIRYAQEMPRYRCPEPSCPGFGWIDLVAVERFVLKLLLDEVCTPAEIEPFDAIAASKVAAERDVALQRIAALETDVANRDRELDELLAAGDASGFSAERRGKRATHLEKLLEEARATLRRLRYELPCEYDSSLPDVRGWLEEMLKCAPFRGRTPAECKWRRCFAGIVTRVEIRADSADGPVYIRVSADRGALIDDDALAEDGSAMVAVDGVIPFVDRGTTEDRRQARAEFHYAGADFPPGSLDAVLPHIAFVGPSLEAYGWTAEGMLGAARYLGLSGLNTRHRDLPAHFGPRASLPRAARALISSGAYRIAVNHLASGEWRMPAPDRFMQSILRPTASELSLRAMLADDARTERSEPSRIVGMILDGVPHFTIANLFRVHPDTVQDCDLAFRYGGPPALKTFGRAPFDRSSDKTAQELIREAEACLSPVLERRLRLLAALVDGGDINPLLAVLGLSGVFMARWMQAYRKGGICALYGRRWEIGRPCDPAPPTALRNAAALRDVAARAVPLRRDVVIAVADFLEGRAATDRPKLETGLSIYRGGGIQAMGDFADAHPSFEAQRIATMIDEVGDADLAKRLCILAKHVDVVDPAVVASDGDNLGSIGKIVQSWRVNRRLVSETPSTVFTAGQLARIGRLVATKVDPWDPTQPLGVDALLRLCREEFDTVVSQETMYNILRKHGWHLRGPRG